MMREIMVKERTLFHITIRCVIACAFFGFLSCGDGSMNGIYNMFGEHPYIFVNPSATGATHDGLTWETAYIDLPSALAAAQNGRGDEIWMTAGSYSGTITAGIKVSLYGGFSGTETSRDDMNPEANPTWIDITIDANDITIEGFHVNGLVVNSGKSISIEKCFLTGTGPDLICSAVTDVQFSKCLFYVPVIGSLSLSVNGSASIQGCTFDGTNAGVQIGSAIYVGSAGVCSISDTTVKNFVSTGDGAGLFIDGYCTITGSTFLNNNAEHGGGIRISGTGTCTLNKSFIDSCSSAGSSYGGGGIYSSGTLIIENRSMIINNTSDGGGGGISIETGTVSIRDSTIDNNTTNTYNGGGIYSVTASPNTVIIRNTLITNNKAMSTTFGGYGGGIYYEGSAPLTILDSKIMNNSARVSGGGIYLSPLAGTFLNDNNTISGNTPP
jgi:hypothetical protein